MSKFKVTYYMTDEIHVNRVIEADSKQEALKIATFDKIQEFEQDRILHKFNLEDVKLVNVKLYC